ncbi:unnamed protein product [Effrenium voratum]|nr:unnamed protein product [Effrenium voratum]
MHLRQLVGAWTKTPDGAERRPARPVCQGDRFCQGLGVWLGRATAVCERCGSMVTARLTPADLRRAPSQGQESVSRCAACRQTKYVVPQAEQVPADLRGLGLAAVCALRPVDLHQGDMVRTSQHGYRYMTQVSRVSWHKEAVQDRIAALTDQQQQDAAQRAYRSGLPQRPAWPRHSWSVRFGLASADLQGSEPEAGEEEGAEAEGSTRRSAKHSFAFKVLGPVLDYGMDLSLGTFMPDRWVFKTLTGAGHSSGLQLNRALAGRALGNAYLNRLRLAIRDLHRQHGHADYFFTLAPFELNSPLSAVVEQSLRATGRSVRGLPALVLHHVLHSSLEAIQQYMLGAREPQRWRMATFADKTGQDPRNVVAWVIRQEMQSGKRAAQDLRRRQPASRQQEYHGRRGAHWHVLVWVRSREAVHYGHVARADFGNTARLRSIVPRVQRSDRPLYVVPNAGPTQTFVTSDHGPAQERHFLHYPTEAFDLCVRPYEVRMLCASALRYMRFRRALESELWSALLSHRAVLASHGLKTVTLPTYRTYEADRTFQKFMASPWREDFGSYAAWLRGMRHDLLEPVPYHVATPVALCLNFCSTWRTDFWEQWLLVFTHLQGEVWALWDPACQTWPRHLRVFGYCLARHPEIWGETGAREELGYDGLDLQTAGGASRLAGEAHDRQGHAWNLVAQQLRSVAACLPEGKLPEAQGICVYGSAGTGKSFAVKAIAAAVHRLFEVEVAITCFTAAGAGTFRQDCPFATVDTVHGLFRVGAEAWDAAPRLLPFGLIVVDEAMMLPEAIVQHIFECWHAIDKLPVLLFAGDRGQLTPFDAHGHLQPGLPGMPQWAELQKVELVEPMRADDQLWPLQEYVRETRPSTASHWWREVVTDRLWQGHSAAAARAAALGEVFEAFPDTLLVCLTRATAKDLNDLAVEAVFGGRAPLATLTLNEDAADTEDQTAEVAVYRGMVCMLTRNLSKERGLVNGAFGRVLAVHAGGVEVQLCAPVGPGEARAIVPRCYFGRRQSMYPLMRAYACTLHKVQGRTLAHCTIVPDLDGVPGAGYCALSRVRALSHLVWLHEPRAAFFTPAV